MKILITGCTAVQVGSQNTQLKIVTAVSCWYNALVSCGYEVDWRPVVPGENLRKYDSVLVVMSAPKSLCASYFFGALYALKARRDAIVCIDDWQIRAIFSEFRSITKNYGTMFSMRRSSHDATLAHAKELYEYAGRIAERGWSHTTLVPLFNGGDVKLLKLELPNTTQVVAIDPTSFAKRYPQKKIAKARQWVSAALAPQKENGVRLTWPILQFSGKHKIPEAQLMNFYCGSYGVVSPKQYHCGSGWWRVRYIMAADAGSIITCCREDAQVFGAAYEKAVDPAYVETLSTAALAKLAREQAETFYAQVQSRTSVVRALKSIL